MFCRLYIGEYRQIKTITPPPRQVSPHPPWEQLSSATTHLGHGLFQGSLQRELGKQGQQRINREKGNFIHRTIPASQIAGHPTSVSTLDLAKGTAALRGCKLKLITCQVHTNQVLPAFRMLWNLITLPSFFFSLNRELRSYFL